MVSSESKKKQRHDPKIARFDLAKEKQKEKEEKEKAAIERMHDAQRLRTLQLRKAREKEKQIKGNWQTKQKLRHKKQERRETLIAVAVTLIAMCAALWIFLQPVHIPEPWDRDGVPSPALQESVNKAQR